MDCPLTRPTFSALQFADREHIDSGPALQPEIRHAEKQTEDLLKTYRLLRRFERETRRRGILAGLKKEMAKPRMVKAARKAEVNQAARVVRGKRGKSKL